MNLAPLPADWRRPPANDTRHVYGDPCWLAKTGWQSPAMIGPGFVSFTPCRVCGVIHLGRKS